MTCSNTLLASYFAIIVIELIFLVAYLRWAAQKKRDEQTQKLSSPTVKDPQMVLWESTKRVQKEYRGWQSLRDKYGILTLQQAKYRHRKRQYYSWSIPQNCYMCGAPLRTQVCDYCQHFHKP